MSKFAGIMSKILGGTETQLVLIADTTKFINTLMVNYLSVKNAENNLL